MVGIFDRWRRRSGGRRRKGRDRTPAGAGRTANLPNPDFAAHLEKFYRTRFGIEAWVEEETPYARPSILLVAHDGEWTRRQVPDEQWAYNWAEKHMIPARRAGVVPYPQRMRDFNARQRAQTRQQQARQQQQSRQQQARQRQARGRRD